MFGCPRLRRLIYQVLGIYLQHLTTIINKLTKNKGHEKRHNIILLTAGKPQATIAYC